MSSAGGGTLESPTTMLFSETAESTATRELRLDGCLACGMTPERMYTMHCHTDSVQPNERVKVQLQRASRSAPRMPYSIELGWLDLGSVEATSHLMTLSRCLGNLSCELGALTFTNSGLDDTHLFHLITALPQSAPLTLLDLSSQHLSGLALTHLIDAGKRGACPLLTSLTLDHNPCGDALPASGSTSEAAARRVGQLPNCGWRLSTLRLVSSLVGEGGVSALARALPHSPALTLLDLRMNEMTLGPSAGAAILRLRAAWEDECGKAGEGLRGV